MSLHLALCVIYCLKTYCAIYAFFQGGKKLTKPHVSQMIQMVIDKVQFRLNVNDLCMTTGITPVSLYCDWADGTVRAWSVCATLSKRLNALWSWLSS